MIADRPPVFYYTGDGSATEFPFPSPIGRPEYINVTIVYPDERVSVLHFGSESAVDPVQPDDGQGMNGQVRLLIQPPPVGAAITIRRDTPIEQITQYDNQGPYYASATEEGFDRLTLICQELARRLDIAIPVPDGLTPEAFGDKLLGMIDSQGRIEEALAVLDAMKADRSDLSLKADLAHAIRHGKNGPDALSPAAIGAMPEAPRDGKRYEATGGTWVPAGADAGDIPYASSTAHGIVRVDGTSIVRVGGVISEPKGEGVGGDGDGCCYLEQEDGTLVLRPECVPGAAPVESALPDGGSPGDILVNIARGEGAWGMPVADADGFGMAKVDGVTIVSENGVLSAVVPDPGDSGGGVSDHRLLTHRDEADQHPSSAISHGDGSVESALSGMETSFAAALDGKAPADAAALAALIGPADTGRDGIMAAADKRHLESLESRLQSKVDVDDPVFAKLPVVTKTYNDIGNLSIGSRGTLPSLNWQDICWSPELELFCAVAITGTGRRVMTSPDGVNWTSREVPFNHVWMSVCWSPELGLFCAVASTVAAGSTDRVMTSPDGVNWTMRTTPNQAFVSVCWSPALKMFCAVANAGTTQIITSADGKSWTSQTTPVSLAWTSICWSPEKAMFVAVAANGTIAQQVMVSTNGKAWASKNSAVALAWQSVCWSPEKGLFCAVANTGTGNRVMTSPDGYTWTTRSSAADCSWQKVCWSPELGLFCAVAIAGPVGNARIMTSADGLVWRSAIGCATGKWRSVCWSPKLAKLCAVAENESDERVALSTDGRNWKSQNAVRDLLWRAIAWSPKERRFCAVGSAVAHMISGEGEAWTSVTDVNASWNSVCWSPEKAIFCVVGYAATSRYSSDGVTWNASTAHTSMVWNGVCWAPELGIFCAVGNGAYTRWSTNGRDWVNATCVGLNWTSVCWSPQLRLFCAVAATGTGNRVMTSPDGKTWIPQRSPADYEWTSVCWSPELSMFCAVAASGSGRVMWSHDGVNWNMAAMPSDNNFRSIAWSPEARLFCAVAMTGSGDRIVFSRDGRNWESCSAPDYEWYGVTWSKELGQFTAVAGNAAATILGDRVYSVTASLERTGRTENLPIATWRIGMVHNFPFDPDGMPDGWYCANGDRYPVNSVQGVALAGLPEALKVKLVINKDSQGWNVPNLLAVPGFTSPLTFPAIFLGA